MKLVVSYDLRNPHRDYDTLWDRLHEWGAIRVLESVWIVNRDTNAANLRDDLRNYIDADDGLLVASLTGEAAWQRLLDSGNSLRAKKAA